MGCARDRRGIESQARDSRALAARQCGTAIVEAVIALPILLVVILGAIQFGLIYQAKATLNHAALQAARAGAVDHASVQAIRLGLARGLTPLYSPPSSLTGVAETTARVMAELQTAARIRILNPTREAFADFGEDVDGEREIPSDALHTRSTTVGPASGLNIQDANLLKVEVTFGYELKVPLVNWFIARVLLAWPRGGLADAFEQRQLRTIRLPILAASTVRMHSPARLNDLMVGRDELPDVARFDPGAGPPPDPEADDDESDTDGGRRDGSSLEDGFLGFGEGSGSGSSGGEEGGDEGGGNPGDGGGPIGGGGGCPPNACCGPPRAQG